MTCVELQQSLAENEEATSWEQKAHLRTCPSCAVLVEELTAIISSAPALLEDAEPSPRVWNSIEATLRQEGLIRPQYAHRHFSSFSARWGLARWLVPAAAALLIGVGIFVHHRSVSSEMAVTAPLTTTVSEAALDGLNDTDLLQEVASQSPELQARYTENLHRVNEYIHDARVNVDANPNDEEARRSLHEAYRQKAMLFDFAMERSLP